MGLAAAAIAVVTKEMTYGAPASVVVAAPPLLLLLHLALRLPL